MHSSSERRGFYALYHYLTRQFLPRPRTMQPQLRSHRSWQGSHARLVCSSQHVPPSLRLIRTLGNGGINKRLGIALIPRPSEFEIPRQARGWPRKFTQLTSEVLQDSRPRHASPIFACFACLCQREARAKQDCKTQHVLAIQPNASGKTV